MNVSDFFQSAGIRTLASTQDVKRGAAALVAAWTVWRLLKAITSVNPLDKVPGPKSESIIFGNIVKLFNPNAWDYHAQLTRDYPTIARVPVGFGNSMLYTKDPVAMYHIMVKDQNIFEETEDFIRVNHLVLGPGLLATLGDHHRKQRKLLNPVFSIAHMRTMIPTFYDVIQRLRNSIKSEVAGGETEVDMAPWLTRTALELVGQSGLGFQFDTLAPGAVMHPYGEAVKKLMGTLTLFSISRFLVLPQVAHIGSARFRRWVVDILPWKKLHVLRDMVDIMHKTSQEILKAKKHALEAGDEVLREQVGNAKDVLSILLKANMASSEEDRMPDEELLGQMTTITFAATDTTSNALCKILEILSGNQEAQDRLRREIIDAKEQNGGENLSYDELVQLPYLDAVCRETLRVFRQVPVADHEPRAREDIILPVSNTFESADGRNTKEVHVPKGTIVILSVLGINNDPSIWGGDAAEWKPERWMSTLPETVTNARIPGIYSHLMTFAGGSRACIGFKFSQLEMKVALCLLLENFRFFPSDKKIRWQFNGIAQPSVEDPSSITGTRMGLPLRVSLVE
ncbi:cytochrome P450 [Coprinopsis sp. MPI-PUGE-AT-0042]|nr:cytochrome P450 [Coprinopsis sp. MPI-PUGE-AT-0042]